MTNKRAIWSIWSRPKHDKTLKFHI